MSPRTLPRRSPDTFGLPWSFLAKVWVLYAAWSRGQTASRRPEVESPPWGRCQLVKSCWQAVS